MPTYTYQCINPKCAQTSEIEQKITDEPITICPLCDAEGLTKIIQVCYSVFKGEGFTTKGVRK